MALEKAGPMQSATSILKGLKIGIPQVCFLNEVLHDIHCPNFFRF